MKTFHVVFLFIFSIQKTEVSTSNIKFSAPHNLPIKLNDNIVLTCKLEDSSLKLPLLISRNTDLVSENCDVYKKNQYGITCKNRTEYKFEIRKMSWIDKGKWTCMRGQNTASIVLDIYVPSNVSIAIQPISRKVFSSNLGPESIPTSHENSIILKGRGKISNPYDLRKNVSVNLICKSDCSYPAVNHMFIFKNFSNVSKELTHLSNIFERNSCDKVRNNSSTVTTLNFNCKTFKLTGLINLTCSTFNVERSVFNISQRTIYILCPTDPIQWWKMTNGEMINTVIGCFMGFILLMLMFLMMCRWKSHKHKNYDSCQDENGDSKLGRGYRV